MFFFLFFPFAEAYQGSEASGQRVWNWFETGLKPVKTFGLRTFFLRSVVLLVKLLLLILTITRTATASASTTATATTTTTSYYY